MGHPHNTAVSKLQFSGETRRSIEGEIKLTRLLILFTLIASVFATADVGGILVQHARSGSIGATVEQSVFIFIVAFLVYGNLVYQFTRLGYLKRKAGHRPAEIDELRSVFKRSGRGLRYRRTSICFQAQWAGPDRPGAFLQGGAERYRPDPLVGCLTGMP
jgi:hypothetical protein